MRRPFPPCSAGSGARYECSFNRGHGPADVETPHLCPTRSVPHRLERECHFNGPAAVETSRPSLPDRVPVAVVQALVGDLSIHPAADRG